MRKFFIVLVFSILCVSAAASKINVRFNDTALRPAIQHLAVITGANVVVDDGVKGLVTAKLQGVTLEEALRILVAGQDATFFYTENGIVVTTLAKAKNFSEGMVCFRLSHVFVKDIRDAVAGMFEQGRVVFDNDTNTIFVLGGYPEQRKMRQVLDVLDRAERQVTLEAQIYAISREDMRKMGVMWDWDKIPQRDSNNNDSSSGSTDEDRNFGGKFRFWREYNYRFSATLNMLEAKGRAKLLATPKLIVVSGKEGKIFVGEKIPVNMEKHDSSGRYTTTEYLDVGVQMQFRPLISEDGKLVTLVTKLDVGTPTLVSEINNYKITSRGSETVVRIKSGETMVIGGLINEEEQRTLQKVPFFSSIPIFGELFKHRTKIKGRVEVIMLLTPYVTEAGEAPTIFNMDEAKRSVFDEKLEGKKRAKK